MALSKKKRQVSQLKGKKAGKAKVQAKVGKKKYVCKVTVKNKKSKQFVSKTQTNTNNTSAKKDNINFPVT